MKKMAKKKDSKKSKARIAPTMNLATERDIAMDFATKIYKEFDQMIKSVVMFGSSAKKASAPGSDIDIIIIIDDVAIQWDEELVAHYRSTLGDVIRANPYKKSLHINTVKLSTWWQDLMRGDPIIVNILRYGDALIDFGGFFDPLKILLRDGLIKSTPESIYTLLQRAPNHLARARTSMLAAVDGLYWACVDAAHAALIAAKVKPASPEQIPEILNETFVDKKILEKKFVKHYAVLHELAKDIIHGKLTEVKGKDLDELYSATDEFINEMAKLVDSLIESY